MHEVGQVEVVKVDIDDTYCADIREVGLGAGSRANGDPSEGEEGCSGWAGGGPAVCRGPLWHAHSWPRGTSTTPSRQCSSVLLPGLVS